MNSLKAFSCAAALSLIGGGVLAASATAPITTTGEPAFPNEPEGYTLVAENYFSNHPGNGAADEVGGRWWHRTGSVEGGRQYLTEDPTAPFGGPHVIGTRWPEGHTAGTGPVHWEVKYPAMREIYVTYFFKFTRPDFEHEPVFTKQIYFGKGGANQHSGNMIGIKGTTGRNRSTGTAGISETATVVMTNKSHHRDPGIQNGQSASNTTARITHGEWNQIEIVLRIGDIYDTGQEGPYENGLEMFVWVWNPTYGRELVLERSRARGNALRGRETGYLADGTHERTPYWEGFGMARFAPVWGGVSARHMPGTYTAMRDDGGSTIRLRKTRDDDQVISYLRVSGIAMTDPAAPRTLTASRNGEGVDLAWQGGEDGLADGFWVYRCEAGERDDRRIAVLPADTTTFRDTDAGSDGQYSYRVQAFIRSDGVSESTEWVSP